MNTAVEAVVDLASPERHPLAKRAKDCAAGAVLLCAIGAAATGLVVFGGKLAERWQGTDAPPAPVHFENGALTDGGDGAGTAGGKAEEETGGAGGTGGTGGSMVADGTATAKR